MADSGLRGAGSRLVTRIVLGLAIASGQLHAQGSSDTAVLTGFVIDVSSGRPVADAIVGLPAQSLEVLTDQDGAFEIAALPVGTHVLTVRRFGYLDLSRAIAIEGSRRHVQLGLEPAPFGIEGLTVFVDGAGAITGRVVEAGSGESLPGVVVWLAAERRGEPADSAGRFRVDDVPYGPQVLQVMRAGYGPRMISVVHGPGAEPIEIVLEPDRGILAALPAVSDRLRGRRNAYLTVVTTHDTERLTRSGAEDVREYLFKYTLTRVVPCSGSAKSFWCIDYRGEPTEPKVCIDGWLEWGGLDLLQRMGPNELHLLEVYGSSGTIIRAYTHEYMESLAGGASGVAGQEPTPQREGVEGVGWAPSRTGAAASIGLRC